ncbi:radical SAM protein [Carboxydothermus ferrireducens]|uniref:Pyruvate-formate lyase-activating enzyme n=1 Tax=Carboxydothermus ferrireducens DSM 11255 TaxID=1119529 RepID=A0ABX2R8E7_9THEO|nr:radical SAM protein [Carboxydothermus ferrireducens]NYE57451.1 pyruvate-formate lyase-activating enzyme [Carboxydothermus ferrireducens DSM 11255]
MRIVVARENGEFFDYPLQPAGRTGNFFTPIEKSELIKLPRGATLVLIPGSKALGFDKKGELRKTEYLAVAALLPQGYTRLFLPAYIKENAERLPLFGYTAVVAYRGELYAAAAKTDDEFRWAPENYDLPELNAKIKEAKALFPENRLVRHLENCAVNYRCFTAQNLFYSRWEGGIPVSPACNARCLGCISLQPADCCPSPQERIKFVPSIDEVASLMTYHLTGAGREGIVSFGQGCEGEPSLQAGLIARAIMETRREVKSGTININTNGGNFPGLKEIIDAGVDSLRVSIISAREEIYESYYQPVNYNLEQVKRTIKYAKEKGKFVALNYLVFPGLSDTKEEYEALKSLLRECRPDMVQFRNLNIDPDYLGTRIVFPSKPFGLQNLISRLKADFPWLILGNYSRPVNREENTT